MAAELPDRRSRPAKPLAAGRMPRRLTDRLEDAVAWLLTSVALLVAVVAFLAGTSVVRAGDARAAAEARERVQVRVVLLEPAVVTPVPDGYSLPVPVDVPGRWFLPGGTERVAPVTVDHSTPAGTELSRWVDRANQPAPPPSNTDRVLLYGVVHGVLVILFGWAGVALCWCGVRRCTAACNLAGWAREWRRVEPEWTGRLPWQ